MNLCATKCWMRLVIWRWRGGPMLARYTGVRAGHALTNQLLRALFATPGAVAVVDCGPLAGLQLPGVGVHRADIPAVA